MPALSARILTVLTALLIGGGLLHAQATSDAFDRNTQPAALEDVTGIWEMTFQRFSQPVDNNPQLTARYQVFAFQKDGYLKNITATRPVSVEDRELFLDIMPEQTRWEMPQDGLLVIRRTKLDAEAVQVYRVISDFQDELLSGSPELKGGDIVLIYTDKEGTPWLRRYLRPIPMDI